MNTEGDIECTCDIGPFATCPACEARRADEEYNVSIKEINKRLDGTFTGFYDYAGDDIHGGDILEILDNGHPTGKTFTVILDPQNGFINHHLYSDCGIKKKYFVEEEKPFKPYMVIESRSSSPVEYSHAYSFSEAINEYLETTVDTIDLVEPTVVKRSPIPFTI